MIKYEVLINDENRARVTLRNVRNLLILPELVWTVEDLFITAVADPGFDVAELEQRSSSPDAALPVLDQATFDQVVLSTEQLIDGEFIGFELGRAQDVDKAVVRLDMLDGSILTIALDPNRVQVTKDFVDVFGDGVNVLRMASRADARNGV